MQPRFVDLGRAKGGTLVHLRSGNPRYLAMKLWLTLYDFAFHLLCSPGIYPYLSVSVNICRQCRLTPAPLHQEISSVPGCD